MWKCAIWMVCFVCTGGTRGYELGAIYRYAYDAVVLVNGVDAPEDGIAAGKPVGFRVDSDVTVTNVWEYGSELLLQVSGSNFRVYTSSGKEHSYNFVQTKSGLEKAKFRSFLHMKDGQVLSAYMDKKIDAKSANVVRGCLSLFQFAKFSEKREEVDISGRCTANYLLQHTGNHVTKFKHNCRTERKSKDHRRTQKILGINHVSKSVVDYKLSADGAAIDSVKAEETQIIEVAIRNQAGTRIYSNQTLTLKETTGEGKTVKGSAVTVAIAALESLYKEELINRGLEVEEVDRKAMLAEPVTLKKLIASKKKILQADNLGSEKAANVYLSLVEVLRNSEKDAVSSALKDKNNAAILPQLLDAVAGAQTVASHQAAVEFLDFESESHLDFVERYLMILSLATNPPEEIVRDIHARAVSGVKVAKVAKSLSLTLAAVTHAFSLTPESSRSKVMKEVEEFIVSTLKKCSDDECRTTQLRCLANLRSDSTLPSLIKYIQNGGKLATVALQSLKSFSKDQYAQHVSLLENVYLRLSKPYDISARTIAFDLVLNAGISDTFLQLVIGQLGKKGEKELKKYVWSKLIDKAEKCVVFQQRLKDSVVTCRKNNYNAMAQGGMSTVFTRLFHKDKSGESGFAESMEIGGGLLKRSAFDVYLKNNESDFDLLSLNLFAGGLSSLAGSSSDDEDVAEDEEDATAGMELSLGGAYLRPIVFFTGQSELLGHVWSGTGSERTTVLQASSLLFDHRQLIPVQAGVAALFVLSGSISFDFAGQIQISLWYKTCKSQVENRAGLAIGGVLALDTVGLSSDVTMNLSAQAQLDFSTEATFSGDVKMCLMMTQPEFTLRHSLSKAVRTSDEKHRVSIRWRKSSTVPGRSFVLNRKNSELCSEMFGNS